LYQGYSQARHWLGTFFELNYIEIRLSLTDGIIDLLVGIILNLLEGSRVLHDSSDLADSLLKVSSETLLDLGQETDTVGEVLLQLVKEWQVTLSNNSGLVQVLEDCSEDS